MKMALASRLEESGKKRRAAGAILMMQTSQNQASCWVPVRVWLFGDNVPGNCDARRTNRRIKPHAFLFVPGTEMTKKEQPD